MKYLKGVDYCSLFVAGSPEPYDDNGNSPTLLNNNYQFLGINWYMLVMVYLSSLSENVRLSILHFVIELIRHGDNAKGFDYLEKVAYHLHLSNRIWQADRMNHENAIEILKNTNNDVKQLIKKIADYIYTPKEGSKSFFLGSNSELISVYDGFKYGFSIRHDDPLDEITYNIDSSKNGEGYSNGELLYKDL